LLIYYHLSGFCQASFSSGRVESIIFFPWSPHTARRLPAGGDFLQAREFILQFAAAHDKILTLEYRQAMGPTAGIVLLCLSAAFSFCVFFHARKEKVRFFAFSPVRIQ
jgi:hypothetical protein